MFYSNTKTLYYNLNMLAPGLGKWQLIMAWKLWDEFSDRFFPRTPASLKEQVDIWGTMHLLLNAETNKIDTSLMAAR